MTHYSNPEDDLSCKHTSAIPRFFLRFMLSLANLIIGAACVLWLNPELPPVLHPMEGMLIAAVSLGITGGLFAVEIFLWKAVGRLFR